MDRLGGMSPRALLCANGSHKPTIRYQAKKIGESPWIGGARGSLVNGSLPRSPLDFARILHRLTAYCVAQATDWNYLLILSKRPLGGQFLVLWSANDRQGTTNGRARHSPTSYVDWAVAMP